MELALNALRMKMILLCLIGIFAACVEPYSFHYYLWGEVRSAEDSTIVSDSVTTMSHVVSTELRPWGRPENDTINTTNSVYGNNYQAWEEERTGPEMLDDAMFNFRIYAMGYYPIEVHFGGKELINRKPESVKSLRVKLPTLYVMAKR